MSIKEPSFSMANEDITSMIQSKKLMLSQSQGFTRDIDCSSSIRHLLERKLQLKSIVSSIHHRLSILLVTIPMKKGSVTSVFYITVLTLILATTTAFVTLTTRTTSRTGLHATISEKEAQTAINKVVAALKKDKNAKEELGNLQSVNNILGYGSPKPGTIAVRFNASFKKGGTGRSAVPMLFGLGQSEKQEGRGTMVGQVKASVDATTGKVLQASVFRDLGYGRAFNLKV